jgi:hypothetical protein
VIGLRGIHARHRALTAAPEVATADDDGDVDAHLADGDDLLCGGGERVAVEALPRRAGQCLTGWFEDDSFPPR